MAVVSRPFVLFSIETWLPHDQALLPTFLRVTIFWWKMQVLAL